MLIGIAGKAGAGKDTVASLLITKRNMQCIPLSLAIKRMLREAFGWELHEWQDRIWKETVQPEWGFSPRQAAQYLGTEWRDKVDPTKLLWCKLLKKYANKMRISLEHVVIPDVRFEHEQDWIHEKGGVIWYINRQTQEINDHISENSINLDLIDEGFANNGTIIDLYTKILQHMMESEMTDTSGTTQDSSLVVPGFDKSQPISVTNNPLAGKTPDEIALHFDSLRNTLVGNVTGQINSTMTGAGSALQNIGTMVTGLHSIVDGLATELSVFHEFEHAIRTGASDLGSLWVSAEQKLNDIRASFSSKADELRMQSDSGATQEKENAQG